MTKPSANVWSGLSLALNSIDVTIENLGWVQEMEGNPKMYQKQIEALRGVRVKIQEDFKTSFSKYQKKGFKG
jgi:hypothetical protein